MLPLLLALQGVPWVPWILRRLVLARVAALAFSALLAKGRVLLMAHGLRLVLVVLVRVLPRRARLQPPLRCPMDGGVWVQPEAVTACLLPLPALLVTAPPVLTALVWAQQRLPPLWWLLSGVGWGVGFLKRGSWWKGAC